MLKGQEPQLTCLSSLRGAEIIRFLLLRDFVLELYTKMGKVEGGMKCVKYLLFVFNFMFWVSGN